MGTFTSTCDAHSWTLTWVYGIHKGWRQRKARRRDNFGLQLDGPVRIPYLYNGKDKTFFMLQWDQSYESSPATSASVNSIPNPQWLTGNFAGAQYYGTPTTQSLMPLVIYDPLSPLVTFKDVDGKTKTAHTPFPGNIIPTNRLDPVGLAIAPVPQGHHTELRSRTRFCSLAK